MGDHNDWYLRACVWIMRHVQLIDYHEAREGHEGFGSITTPNFVLFRVLSFKVFAARANFPMTIQTISVQREFTAETRSTPRKEFYQVKLLTLRPLCLCGESFLCPFGAALPRWVLRGEYFCWALQLWFLWSENFFTVNPEEPND